TSWTTPSLRWTTIRRTAMSNPCPLRPQAKVEIVKQSRDQWKDDAGALAHALDAMSFVALHGNRPQQIEAAQVARGLLRARRYPIRASGMRAFDVTVRTANGYQYWQAV